MPVVPETTVPRYAVLSFGQLDMKEWILIVVPIEPIIIIPHVLFHSFIPSKPKASVPATDPQELAPRPSHPVQAVADPDEDSSAEQLWPEAYTGIS